MKINMKKGDKKEVEIPPEGLLKIKKVLDAIQKRHSLNPSKRTFEFELGGLESNLKNENDYLELVDILEGLQKRAEIKYTIDRFHKPDRFGRRFPVTLYDSFKCKITIVDSKKFENYYNKISQRYLLIKKGGGEKTNNWLVCGDLKFNKENGDVKLGKVEGNLAPETNEYKVFLHLLESPSYMAKYTTLIELMSKGALLERLALDTVIRNIKMKLGILPKKKSKNKDIFQTLKNWKGYRLKLK